MIVYDITVEEYIMHSVFLSLYVQFMGPRVVVLAEYSVEFVDGLVRSMLLRLPVLVAGRHGSRLWERRVWLRWQLSAFGRRFELRFKCVDCLKY